MILLAVLLFPYYGFAETAASPVDMFREAGDLYNQGLRLSGEAKKQHMEKAAAIYESIISENGIHNGYLYYNLGNCYYHASRPGKAIINWRRSERYIPSYPDLRENLRWGLAERQDAIEESQAVSIARNLFFWHYFMGLQLKVTVCSIFVILTFILLGVRLFRDHGVLLWGVVLCAIFSILFGGSAAIEAYHYRFHRDAVIVAPEILARKGPAKSYDRAFEQPLHEGTELSVLSESDDWVRGKLRNGDICWLEKNGVETVW